MAESVEVGRRVRLPNGAERPIQVFINGQLLKEKVGRGRWLAMALGLFGSYGENETVDVHFRRGGKTQVITDANILED
jgi:hypothetical protein